MNELVQSPRAAPRVAHCYRATVCLWADSLEEKTDFTVWLTRWKRTLSFMSPDYGCGCCIHLFDVAGPKAAIDALAPELLMLSQWTEDGISPGLACTRRGGTKR